MSIDMREPSAEAIMLRIFATMGPHQAEVTFGHAATGKEILAAIKEAKGSEFKIFYGREGFSPALVGSQSLYPGAHTVVFALTEKGASLIAPETSYTKVVIKGIEPRQGGDEYAVGGDPLARQEQAVRQLAEALDKKFCA